MASAINDEQISTLAFLSLFKSMRSVEIFVSKIFMEIYRENFSKIFSTDFVEFNRSTSIDVAIEFFVFGHNEQKK